MAHDLLTLADVIGDALDLADIEVSDVLNSTPMLDSLGMEESSNGETHKYHKKTGAPVVGFRDMNAGRDLDHSTGQDVTVTLKHLDFSWGVDVARANASRKGREYVIAREGLAHIESALQKFEAQVINGVVGASDSAAASGDADGFTGFRDAATIDAVADGMVISAGAGTADANSSVYGVRLAGNGVVGIFKGNGPAIQLGDTTVIERVVNPGTDNKTFPMYYTDGGIWLALQVGSAYDLGRIANLDATNTLDDDHLADLLTLYPVGKKPTHFVMSMRSVGQLRKSRTATNATGVPAPFPTESHGVKIIVTDHVSDTEEILA